MADVNSQRLIGRLGQAPKLNFTGNQVPITTLNLWTNEKWKDQQGDLQERATNHRVVVRGRNAENACKYLTKGSLVHIEGPTRKRTYTDATGESRLMTEVNARKVDYLNIPKAVENQEPSTESLPNDTSLTEDEIPF